VATPTYQGRLALISPPVLLLIRLKCYTNTLKAYGRPFLCGLHHTFTWKNVQLTSGPARQASSPCLCLQLMQGPQGPAQGQGGTKSPSLSPNWTKIWKVINLKRSSKNKVGHVWSNSGYSVNKRYATTLITSFVLINNISNFCLLTTFDS